jgi:hypothetical protein
VEQSIAPLLFWCVCVLGFVCVSGCEAGFSCVFFCRFLSGIVGECRSKSRKTGCGGGQIVDTSA